MADFSDNTSFTDFDHQMMLLALEQAQEGAKVGEVPVGAVLTVDNKVVSVGYNQSILNHDPTAHAEIVVLKNTCCTLNNYRLPENSCLYVTLEPCTMCIGALIHARLNRLVFATTEPKAGAVVSHLQLLDAKHYNHNVLYQHGLMAETSSTMLKQFFKNKRMRVKKNHI